MNRVFFSSDHHFGHAAQATRRGFATLEEHDNFLVARWNATVDRGDTVYHLGDFAWHDAAGYRARLNGQVHLVRGNHDRLKAGDEKLFASVSDYKKVKVGDQKIYLLHYAMRVWNASHHGSWHLYGHSHGNLPDDPHARSLDVGVDPWEFYPVSYEQVAARMALKQWKPVDHHTQ